MSVKTKEQLRQFIDDAMPELINNHQDVILAAMAGSGDAMRRAMEEAGLSVTERTGLTTDMVDNSRKRAIVEGRIDNGLGLEYRKRCEDVATDVRLADGSIRKDYLLGREDTANAWLRAFMSRDSVDPVTERGIRDLRDELEKGVKQSTRAPSDPFLGEQGQAGGALVPTIVTAQIFEEANERFVMKEFVQLFTSAAPLNIPRRTAEVTVSRGGLATDIGEDKPETGFVHLSPQRVGVITYHDPLVVRAAAVGPIRWVVGQIAEAIAKDDQRVIIAGSESDDEPRGISNLPTSGGNSFDNAKTAAYDNTSVATERASMREAYYNVNQRHRQSGGFVWAGNNDALRELASHNDRDRTPWSDDDESYLRKQFVETSALSTAASSTTIVGGDMNQYAWLESPLGLRLETTTVGGEAWESDTIGVKAVQYVDGAPVIPPAFTVVTSVDV